MKKVVKINKLKKNLNRNFLLKNRAWFRQRLKSKNNKQNNNNKVNRFSRIRRINKIKNKKNKMKRKRGMKRVEKIGGS